MAKQAVFNPPMKLKHRYSGQDAWLLAVDDWDWLVLDPRESREPRWTSALGYEVITPQEEAVVADH